MILLVDKFLKRVERRKQKIEIHERLKEYELKSSSTLLITLVFPTSVDKDCVNMTLYD